MKEASNSIFEIVLKPGRERCWHAVILSGPTAWAAEFASLVIEQPAPQDAFRRFFKPLSFGRRRLRLISVFCVPPGGSRLELVLHGAAATVDGLRVRMVRIPRFVAALALIGLTWRSVLGGDGRLSWRQRLRYASVKLGQPESYEIWHHIYDRWRLVRGAADRLKAEPPVSALIFDTGGDAALEATCTALLPQVAHIEAIKPGDPTMLRARLDGMAPGYVLVLNAGEIPAPYAVGALCHFAEAKNLAIAYADEDRMDAAGGRFDPWFKPSPSRTLMLSGALATGAWLIRHKLLAGFTDAAAGPAEALRLDAWLRLDASAAAARAFPASGRLPFVLTHRRPDMAPAMPAALATLVRHHLGDGWAGTIGATNLPLVIRPDIAGVPLKISLIVASTGRLPHITSCLAAILERTDYPDFEMIIVLSQSTPPDTAQLEIIGPALADPRVRLVLAPMPRFNYATANNAAIRHSAAPLICLLNDDVAPLAPDWLAVMAGHLQDARIAAVGAKLYYPEGTVQHGGVIMGLGGLCDHAFRFLPRGAAGYAGRAVLDQELSAVTGACMLIRRAAFDAAGGLDEVFASAFNDIDLCVKLRAAGHGIVWSAQAELWHHETVSFKHHYHGERADQEQQDIKRLLERWLLQGGTDPFHNPNLSLENPNEWELAFPPRLGDWQDMAGLEMPR